METLCTSEWRRSSGGKTEYLSTQVSKWSHPRKVNPNNTNSSFRILIENKPIFKVREIKEYGYARVSIQFYQSKFKQEKNNTIAWNSIHIKLWLCIIPTLSWWWNYSIKCYRHNKTYTSQNKPQIQYFHCAKSIRRQYNNSWNASRIQNVSCKL